eukprot:TRINITY_DN65827_c5_g1_i1.p1 TRINITY_DN65827_c5_g1~~TRINITY_DN65827_c5_g1_i1.p1  ORF type:complete len:720 (+),score=418.55 TRINITY_DN65827_c5_g1_i1:228-2387(+)
MGVVRALTASSSVRSLRDVRRLRAKNRVYFRVGGFVVLLLAAVLWSVAAPLSSWPQMRSAEQPAMPQQMLPQQQGRRLLEDQDLSNYPPELFSDDELSKGAVVLHVLGVMYMFVALAIVCDEFFVPALQEIVDRLQISQDVAGATFMAAGGSAPELFTSFIGTFIAVSNVGLGTIVGSAVFNVLFVIGMCAIFSKELLHLTWWPLARDSVCYSISLICLVGFFEDRVIEWYEALMLLLLYAGYVTVMKYNSKLNILVAGWVHDVKAKYGKGKGRKTVGSSADIDGKPSGDRGDEEDVEMDGAGPEAKSGPQPVMRGRSMTLAQMRSRMSFHAGALAVMLHNIDAKGKGEHAERDTRFKRAGLMVMANNMEERRLQAEKDNNNDKKKQQANPFAAAVKKATAAQKAEPAAGIPVSDNTASAAAADDDDDDEKTNGQSKKKQQNNNDGNNNDDDDPDTSDSDAPVGRSPSTSIADLTMEVVVKKKREKLEQEEKQRKDSTASAAAAAGAAGGDAEALAALEEGGGIDLSWPKDDLRAQIIYIILLPLAGSLSLTLPDVQKPEKKKYFVVTFLGSILWIGVFSYFMVWWATVVGNVANIPPEVMGLTFLAAGTSVPDLLTSVIVAREGFGDMAVSSSIGSNIFDVTVGLPLPWIFYTMINGPVSVGSDGLFSSVIILFAMLMMVILTIAYYDWAMTKGLGYVMFVLYALFVTQNLLVEYGVI